MAPHKDGGQAQFIERLLPISGSDNRLSQVLDWVGHHLDEPHSVDSLAERAAMSRHNFTRHFRQLNGTSFKQWLLSQRLSYAQRILETSDASSYGNHNNFNFLVVNAVGEAIVVYLHNSFVATMMCAQSILVSAKNN